MCLECLLALYSSKYFNQESISEEITQPKDLFNSTLIYWKKDMNKETIGPCFSKGSHLGLKKCQGNKETMPVFFQLNLIKNFDRSKPKLLCKLKE